MTAGLIDVDAVALLMFCCRRAKKVHDGVTHAAKLFPNAYIIMIAIGAIKGNGAGFVKVAERLCRGVWTPTAVEFLVPNL